MRRLSHFTTTLAIIGCGTATNTVRHISLRKKVTFIADKCIALPCHAFTLVLFSCKDTIKHSNPQDNLSSLKVKLA